MADESFHSLVRLNSADRSKLLCRLDEAPGRPGQDRRRFKRWEYRMSDIAVLVQHPGGGTGRYLVCARNLSAAGLSCIHGGYIHPGSECKVVMRRREGTPFAVTGVVIYCRHVEGSYHEVGIHFTEEVDPMSLLPDSPVEAHEPGDPSQQMPTLEGHVLVVDASAPGRKLMTHHLGATGLGLTLADTPTAALEALRKREFQLVLCGINPVDDAIPMIQQMRSAGFKGRIVVSTAENSPARLGAARAAGANDIVGRPAGPAYLGSLMAEWLRVAPVDRPIFSPLEERPGMGELIADFIDEAKRKATQIEKSLGGTEPDGLREICLELAGSGSGFGFDAVSEAARDALTTLDTVVSSQDAASPLRRLASICQRLRCATPVHRT